jgi:hypothetical protein
MSTRRTYWATLSPICPLKILCNCQRGQSLTSTSNLHRAIYHRATYAGLYLCIATLGQPVAFVYKAPCFDSFLGRLFIGGGDTALRELTIRTHAGNVTHIAYFLFNISGPFLF